MLHLKKSIIVDIVKASKKCHYVSEMATIQLLNAVDSFIMTFIMEAGN